MKAWAAPTSRPVVYVAVAALLGVMFALAATSVLNKCNTYDELVHITAGYGYWTLNDYRIDPENGNLPQRWMALPLLAGEYTFPSLDHDWWNEWMLSYNFLYRGGNDTDTIVFRARLMIAALAVVLGAIVYAWSSRLYGRGGGLISAVLCCFSTAILANGRLATSDLTAALFFLASVGCIWGVLNRLTLPRLLGSAVVMGLLFVAKMSAVLIVPMGLALIIMRLAHNAPLPVRLGPLRRDVAGAAGQAGLFLATVAVHAAVVIVVIWAFYGFRYSAVNPSLAGNEQFAANWDKVLVHPFPMRGAITFARDHKLLPEAYLMGQAHVLKHSQIRLAFLNGQYSSCGWWWFFPYCLLTKTQLPLFVILALVAGSAVAKWRARPSDSKGKGGHRTFWQSLYRTAPLWALLVVYWATAISSNINIGHRHILPTYPAMFILAGGAARLLRGRRGKLAIAAVIACLVLYAGEALWIHPHYLAYFNQLVGGPGNGYRHLVDSSLDWGQDLPGLKAWLDREGLTDSGETPVYLGYFGTASPTHYGIHAHRLPGFIDLDVPSRPFQDYLTGGVYCVSATILQTVITKPPGPWTYQEEVAYKELRGEVEQLIHLGRTDPRKLQETLRGVGQAELQDRLKFYDLLRAKRLFVYLRNRPRGPDANIGYSILIYRMSYEEVAKALLGPPPEITSLDPNLYVSP